MVLSFGKQTSECRPSSTLSLNLSPDEGFRDSHWGHEGTYPDRKDVPSSLPRLQSPPLSLLPPSPLPSPPTTATPCSVTGEGGRQGLPRSKRVTGGQMDWGDFGVKGENISLPRKSPVSGINQGEIRYISGSSVKTTPCIRRWW